MKRKLSIFQYGSQFDPNGPTHYSPSDWIEISVSESSPSEGKCSIGAPQVSNSSASDASTGVQNELPSDLHRIYGLFQENLDQIGIDLPSNWSLQEFLPMVIGEEEVLDPSYLSDVYSNLVECGFYSCYWEHAFELIKLINGW